MYDGTGLKPLGVVQHVERAVPSTITLREWLAGMALQGSAVHIGNPTSVTNAQRVAERAAQLADKLIAELEKSS